MYPKKYIMQKVRFHFAIAAALVWWLFPANLYAQALNVTELTQLDYGMVERPAAGSVTVTINTNNGVSGTGTILGGSQLTGVFRVTGSALKTVDIDVQAGSMPGGITLDSFTATYDGQSIVLPATGLSPPGFGGRLLKIGATVTVSSSASEGQLSPAFDIIASQ